jgi:hypothetical protein
MPRSPPVACRYGYRDSQDAANTAAAQPHPSSPRGHPQQQPASAAGGRAGGASRRRDDDSEDDDEGRAAAEAEAGFTPLFLHAHSLVLRRPDRRPVKVVAPLPRHMRALVASRGWKLQKEDTVGGGGGGGGAAAGPAAAVAMGLGLGAARAARRRAAAAPLTKRALGQWAAGAGGGSGAKGAAAKEARG